jgi:hypothetical protein
LDSHGCLASSSNCWFGKTTLPRLLDGNLVRPVDHHPGDGGIAQQWPYRAEAEQVVADVLDDFFAGGGVELLPALLQLRFRWILPAQLSTSELAIWRQNERILAFIGGRPRSVRDIRISETMTSGTLSSRETEGLWDPENGCIILKRSLLRSLDAYAGTLLHEALHAKYALSDVSREFELYLTDLCGKLAAQIISAKNGT